MAHRHRHTLRKDRKCDRCGKRKARSSRAWYCDPCTRIVRLQAKRRWWGRSGRKTRKHKSAD